MPGGIGDFGIGITPIGGVQRPLSPPPLNLYPGAETFPPIEPTGMQWSIPSYLYDEYNDDDDLQAFVYAYNDMAQAYVDWFNEINLPIYTGLSGPLLDWVGQGVYGVMRPTLYSNQPYNVGEFNTYALNTIGFNEGGIFNDITDVTVTDDDIYQRVITWHFYKGDGKQASAQWFRKRAVRFLYGANGSDYTAPAQNVSVVIGGGFITITVVSSLVKMASGAAFNSFGFNSFGLNKGTTTTVATFAVPSSAVAFVEAINTGALEMPSQFSSVARIGALGIIG